MKTKTTKATSGVSAKKTRPSMTKHEVRTDELLKIAARLKDQIGKVDPGPSWQEKAVAALTDGRKEDGIIRAVQIYRDHGVMNQEKAFCQIRNVAVHIALEHDSCKTDAELLRIARAMHAIKEREGLRDKEEFDMGSPATPEDYKALDAEWARRAAALVAAVLQAYGENEMADRVLAEGF